MPDESPPPQETPPHLPPEDATYVWFGPRERTTYDELAQLNRGLANLFRLGHELLARREDTGARYLIAHAGREVGRGIVNELGGEDVRGDATIAPEEGNRRTIGAMLQLRVDHPLVAKWFELHALFAQESHVLYARRSPQEVEDAFRAFSNLLYGRVAPFFSTQEELKELLGVEQPADAHIDRARALLARPQQRLYFFSKLDQPGWLPGLTAAGYFYAPPERVVEPDGTWRMRGWPEGDYLTRVSAREPARVVELLQRIPPSLENPAVWNAVVESGLQLPPAVAAGLVPLLKSALRNAPAVLFPHTTIQLVKHLADSGEIAAFDLAEALLQVRQAHESTLEGSSLTLARHGSRHSTEWVLAKLDAYELEQFVSKTLPALVRLSPTRAVSFLADRLLNVMRTMRKALSEKSEDDFGSRWWCEDLRNVGRDGDIREIFATSLAKASIDVGRNDEAAANAVWEILESHRGGIFERIRWYFLAAIGDLLPDNADEAISSELILNAQFGGREAAELLRNRYSTASDAARAVFRYALGRGPDPDDAKHVATYRLTRRQDEAPSSADPVESSVEAELQDYVQQWQKTRLRWFHDRIPDDLKQLADSLGVVPAIPSPQDQALDEVGHYSSGVWASSGERSPLSVEQIAELSAEDLADFLVTWVASDRTFDAPTREGLGQSLRDAVSSDSVRAVAVAQAILQRRAGPDYLDAVIGTLNRNAESEQPLLWASVLPLAAEVVRAANAEMPGPPTQDDGTKRDGGRSVYWPFAFRKAIDLVADGCRANAIPVELLADVWAIAKSVVESPLISSDRTGSDSARGIGAGFTTVSGRTVQLVVEVGLWEYRSREHPQPDMPALPPMYLSMVPALLERLLHDDCAGAFGARVSAGTLLPYVYLLAPTWLEENETSLLDGGVTRASQNPLWLAYLTGSRVFEKPFSRFRRWYEETAASIGEAETLLGDHDDRDFSMGYGLAKHVLIATLSGFSNLGDSDMLVEQTFRNVAVAERARTYWLIFRGWTDNPEKVPSAAVSRLVALWEWRLEQLEGMADDADRQAEADGLMWFFLVDLVGAADAIRLGVRTARLSTGERRTSGSAWERVSKLAEIDPIATFALTEVLVKQELDADFVYLPFEHAGPPLQAALRCPDVDTQNRARRLVNSIGERGRLEFGDLLIEIAGDSEEKG